MRQSSICGAFLLFGLIFNCKIALFSLFSQQSERRDFSFKLAQIMIVGTEWIIDVAGCDAEKLRDLDLLRRTFDRIITDLNLKVVGDVHWHQFPLPGNGITGLALLTESHLACHTYPESNLATFNLYCCRARPEWNWEENFRALFNARKVNIQKIERGSRVAISEAKTAVGGDLR